MQVEVIDLDSCMPRAAAASAIRPLCKGETGRDVLNPRACDADRVNGGEEQMLFRQVLQPPQQHYYGTAG